MKIKALKTLVGNYGRLNEGQITELPDWQASVLVARSYVARITETEDDGYKDTQAQGGKLYRGRRGKYKA